MIQTEIEKRAVKNFAKFLIDNYKLDELEFTSTELLDACVEFFQKAVIYEERTFEHAPFYVVSRINNKIEKETTFRFLNRHLYCGKVVEISIDGKNWTKTSIEHNGKRYYATSNPSLELQGLFCRFPEVAI